MNFKNFFTSSLIQINHRFHESVVVRTRYFENLPILYYGVKIFEEQRLVGQK